MKLVEVVRKVGKLENSRGDYSTYCHMLSNLLSFIFNCVTWTSKCLLQGVWVGVVGVVCVLIYFCYFLGHRR